MIEDSRPSWGAILLVPATIAAIALTAGFWAQVYELRQFDARFDERMTNMGQRLNVLTARLIELDDRQRQISVNTDRLSRLEAQFQRLDEEGSRAALVLQQRLSVLEKRRK